MRLRFSFRLRRQYPAGTAMRSGTPVSRCKASSVSPSIISPTEAPSDPIPNRPNERSISASISSSGMPDMPDTPIITEAPSAIASRTEAIDLSITACLDKAGAMASATVQAPAPSLSGAWR